MPSGFCFPTSAMAEKSEIKRIPHKCQFAQYLKHGALSFCDYANNFYFFDTYMSLGSNRFET